MVTAILLVEADRNALSTLGERLAAIDGVSEVYSVTGQWDFVAMIRIPRHEQLAEVLCGFAEIGASEVHLIPTSSDLDQLRRAADVAADFALETGLS